MLNIKKRRLNKIHIDISQALPKNFKLDAESTVKVKTPKNKEEKTLLILMETHIGIPNSDDINIILNVDFVFEFDEVPNDYDSIVKDEIVPLAQKDLFKTLDNILVEMGYKELGLAEEE
ncbi:hypothetical protein Ami103574_10715 [Aminipila butyrica]|uniref:Uncharacterized protein n=1 Tax=Aminipila butyrica TaxID=433296 RepID=A0A858BUZ4_9FIRM|nr:hypothetical protein [Aminipila butyrica]QIB69763.1 hypothetical protein Ami103574_10715 [Aminipila butyrica]